MNQLSKSQYQLLKKIYSQSPMSYFQIKKDDIENCEYLARLGYVHIETKTVVGDGYLNFHTERVLVRIKPEGEAIIDYIKRLKKELWFTRLVAITGLIISLIEAGLLIADKYSI